MLKSKCRARRRNTETTVEKQSHEKPWQFKPGQSGNPSGRPKGSRNKLVILLSGSLAVLAVVFLLAGANHPAPSPRSVEALFAPCLAAHEPDPGLIARQAARQPSFVPADAPSWQPPLGPRLRACFAL